MRAINHFKLWICGAMVLFLVAGCCSSTTSGLVPPTILSVSPVSGTSATCPTSTVTAVFSEAMNATSINTGTFTLTAPGNVGVAGTVTYNSSTSTALFTPSAALLAGTLYTATIGTGVKDLFGNQLASNFVWSFTTAANGCNPAPTLMSFSPVAASSTACPNATINATFSEAMNPATINTTTFSLAGPGATRVVGLVTYVSATHTAVFTPSANLAAGTLYTASLGTGIQDTFGNPLAAASTSSFTTAATGCHPAPQLLSVTPFAGSSTACPNASVVATFNEAMNPATINATTFSLAPGVIGTISHDATNAIYTLTPSSNLAANATYTSTLTTGVQDTYGNPLAAPSISTFTTAANSCRPAPTAAPGSPASGATGVCPNKVITALFSEPMDPLTINTNTFSLAGPGGTAVAGQVTYDATTNTAIFTPAKALALNSTYTATVSTGVKDLYGNALAAPLAWSFATGANACLPAAPPVTVTPANGVTGICPSSAVAATFAQAMNPATLNATTFTLTAPGGTLVLGTVSADTSGKLFTFTPTTTLALSTTYTATITTGAQDTFGNALASNYSWSFTTGAAICGVTAPPVVNVPTPAIGAVGVCANTVLTATFSEPMNPSTINAATFLLSNGATGAVTLDATGTIAAFTPSAPLALNTVYMATITTGAMDLFGNALASNYSWSFTTSALPCQTAVPLGSAANFTILGGSTVTNTGATIVTGGDLGLSPGSSVTGFPPGIVTPPALMQITNQVAAQGQLDLTIAYNDAAGLTGGAVLPADLTGQTLTPGLYTNASTVTLSGGNVTLDAQGNANAVFIFQVGSTLTMLGNTQVILAGGAQAKNIFWQVGSSATLGTNSIFKGTILALQSISLQTGANLQGRALARNGAVTLDSNIVTAP